TGDGSVVLDLGIAGARDPEDGGRIGGADGVQFFLAADSINNVATVLDQLTGEGQWVVTAEAVADCFKEPAPVRLVLANVKLPFFWPLMDIWPLIQFFSQPRHYHVRSRSELESEPFSELACLGGVVRYGKVLQ